MKTVVVCNHKGGVGKTMITLHLVWYAARAGKRVLLIDFDPQGDASRMLEAGDGAFTASRLFDNGVPKDLPTALKLWDGGSAWVCRGDGLLVDIDKHSEVLAPSKCLKHWDDRFDVCVIDTPPTLGALQVSALLCANRLLIPIEAATQAINNAMSVLGTAMKLKSEYGTKLETPMLLANKVNSSDPDEQSLLMQVRESAGEAVVPKLIKRSVAVKRSSDRNIPVWAGVSGESHREAAKSMLEICASVYEGWGVSK